MAKSSKIFLIFHSLQDFEEIQSIPIHNKTTEALNDLS